jgi:hypothetical protein
MTSCADLHLAVETTLASGRLGRPVFVRYLVQSRDPGETVIPRLARLLCVIRAWLGQPLERLYGVGSAAAGQVSLTVQFRDGATALITFSRGQPGGAGVDLLVLGNHGSLAFDAENDAFWEEMPQGGEPAPDDCLQAAIEQSLASGRPVSMASEGRP